MRQSVHGAAAHRQRSAPRGGCGVAGERWGRQAPSTAGGRGGGRHARGVSVASCDHRAPWHGGRVWGAPLPRTLPPVRVRAVRSLPGPPALRHRRAGSPARGPGLSCGHSTVSPAASAAGVVWCGDPGVSVASWPRLVVIPLAAPGVSRCGPPPTAGPPTGAASVPGVRSPEGVAGGSRRWGAEAGGSWGAPRGSLPRPQTVPGPASPCGGLPRAQGAGCACSAFV